MRIRRLAATLALAALPAAALAPAQAVAADPMLPIGQIQGPVTDADDGATHRSPKDFPGDGPRGASDHDPLVATYGFSPGGGPGR